MIVIYVGFRVPLFGPMVMQTGDRHFGDLLCERTYVSRHVISNNVVF